MLCKYKNIFGEPNTGLHKYRFFGVAAIDLFLTIFIAFLIAFFIHKKINYNIYYTFLIFATILFLLGIILHHLFCVKTTIDKLLFTDTKKSII
jgi:hypothetical protein